MFQRFFFSYQYRESAETDEAVYIPEQYTAVVTREVRDFMLHIGCHSLAPMRIHFKLSLMRKIYIVGLWIIKEIQNMKLKKNGKRTLEIPETSNLKTLYEEHHSGLE